MLSGFLDGLMSDCIGRIVAGELMRGLKVFAGTGHRPDKLGGYSESTRHRVCGFAWSFLRDHPCNVVISGMAQGWDQALAEAATQHGIPFIAAVPFTGQERAWPLSAQKHYRDLLSKAAAVEIVDKDVRGFDEVRLAMSLRNRWMVDRAGHVVALWDGSSGGTANCVAYARKKNKKIYSLWDQWEGSGA